MREKDNAILENQVKAFCKEFKSKHKCPLGNSPDLQYRVTRFYKSDRLYRIILTEECKICPFSSKKLKTFQQDEDSI